MPNTDLSHDAADADWHGWRGSPWPDGGEYARLVRSLRRMRFPRFAEMADISVAIGHRNGTPWNEAPLPMPWHRCSVQTQGWIELDETCRCACGAINENARGWKQRNSRRFPLLSGSTPRLIGRKGTPT